MTILSIVNISIIPVFGIAEVQKLDFKNSDYRNSRDQEVRLQEF